MRARIVPLTWCLLLLLAGCGGTSSWTWSWASADGHSTLDARYDGTAAPVLVDAYGFAAGDPRFEAPW